LKIRSIWFASLALSFGAACQAQLKPPDGTLGGMLNGYLAMLGQQCPARAKELEQAKAKKDIGATVALGGLYQTMCVCHPLKTRALLTSLPASRLAAPARDENQFDTVAVPGIMEPCAGEQLHQMYEGSRCDGFKSTDIRNGTTEAAFCACMKGEMADWRDVEAASLMRDLGPYNAKLRASKTSKGPKPDRSALVRLFIDSLHKCGGGEEFKD
jgi:hypothetical protein